MKILHGLSDRGLIAQPEACWLRGRGVEALKIESCAVICWSDVRPSLPLIAVDKRWDQHANHARELRTADSGVIAPIAVEERVRVLEASAEAFREASHSVARL
jgi:hypothetical protein